MAARKGIKAKITQWFRDNPDAIVPGWEIERMYVEHGGAVNSDSYPKSRRGRVSLDTMKALISRLPIAVVVDTLSPTTKKAGMLRSRWQYSKVRDDQLFMEAEAAKATRRAWRVKAANGPGGAFQIVATQLPSGQLQSASWVVPTTKQNP